MKRVMIAGATGYLGRHLCAEFRKRGWHVTALARPASHSTKLNADCIVTAEATKPATLKSVMSGIDLVISALGITRQTDGLTYREVDYKANLNLLEEALAAGVGQFGYVHVLNADRMPDVPLVAAKNAFVRKLQTANVRSTVIAPSGYFSDMEDFMAMARSGRVWLFGDGKRRINPIDGTDLAEAIHGAIERGDAWLDVGGPDAFTHNQIAALCFEALGKPARITRLPYALRRAALHLLPRLAPRRIAGPAQFFLTAFGMDMVGAPTGHRRLADHLDASAHPSPNVLTSEQSLERIGP